VIYVLWGNLIERRFPHTPFKNFLKGNGENRGGLKSKAEKECIYVDASQK
jgi:hypothetical protein